MRYKVVGPPGTGKTRRLLNEVHKYVKNGTPHYRIGYFAFTRKAAGEARDRFLAKNLDGYHNFMKLCSIGFLEGFYYRPRVDKELLKKYNAGLIATSGCLAGEITAHAAAGDYENAKNAALEYAEIFPNRFYLELQNHDIPEEKKAHVILKKLASELNLPLVATNDCHYCYKQDSDAHDVLFCLGTGKDKADPNRLRYEPGKFYVKSADEMYRIFKDVPESLENTVKIASQCDVELPLGQYHLPAYPVPENTSPDGFLKEICISGLKERYSEITPNMNQRLNYDQGYLISLF